MTQVLGPWLPRWAIPRLLLLVAFLGVAWLAMYLYVLSDRRSTVIMEAVSPTGAYLARVINTGDYWGLESFITVHDDSATVEQGRTKTILRTRHVASEGEFSLYWETDAVLVIEYPYWYDPPTSHPSMISQRDISPWQGLSFVMRAIPSYWVVIYNRRPEHLKFSGRPPGRTIDECGQDEFSWRDPRQPVQYTYEDADGNVVFSVRLHSEVIGETMMIKDGTGNVVTSTLLGLPLHSGNIGEISLVIPSDPGKECAPTREPGRTPRTSPSLE